MHQPQICSMFWRNNWLLEAGSLPACSSSIISPFVIVCLFVCYEVSPGVGCCGGRLAGLLRQMSCGYESAELLNLHNEYSTDVLVHPRKIASETRCFFISRAYNFIA